MALAMILTKNGNPLPSPLSDGLPVRAPGCRKYNASCFLIGDLRTSSAGNQWAFFFGIRKNVISAVVSAPSRRRISAALSPSFFLPTR